MDNSFNWKSFTHSIGIKGIVPVLGNDLSWIRKSKKELDEFDGKQHYFEIGTEDGEYIRMNLYKYLALQLWNIHEQGPITTAVNVNIVATHLLSRGVSEFDIIGSIKSEIANLSTDEIILDPYIKLINIKGFDCFITVNFDNFLERAFEAEGKNVNTSLNFAIPFPATNPNERKDDALPRIYNLMGNIDGYNFAITDEQSLEYLYMLQNGIDTIAKELFDIISRKSILMVGSSFPDWFMRFFIRIISNERYISGGKAKYVACDSTLQDNELKTFLECNYTKVIPIDNRLKVEEAKPNVFKNSIEFIDQMYEQCAQTNERNKDVIKYKEKAFISYSWNDKSLAERFKNELENNGVEVFFDDDELKTGDRYNAIIKKYLTECDFFIALISENSIGDASRYVYDKEWKFAIFFNDERNYIRPYIIDQTQPVDSRIPEEMRELNIRKIENFDTDLPKVVREFIQENKLTKLSD